MGLPRSKYVQEGQEGVYHCFSRCVRRAFLCGFDPLTHRDFSHRKAWLIDRLRYLASFFAIDVCAHAVMENHYHAILRTRPDIVDTWSDYEVGRRWLTLCPRYGAPRNTSSPPKEKEIRALADWPECIAKLRRRLCSLSWFMGRLNEFISRAANKEDRVKGRFWESRFKCQALLDEAAIASCMVYVDLNPIRAGSAGTPEESNFTSIQERIRAWQKKTMTTTSDPSQATQDIPSDCLGRDPQMPDKTGDISGTISQHILSMTDSSESEIPFSCWLCPIRLDSKRRGILQMTTIEYFKLVDRSARMLRLDKRGAMDADLMPIMQRLGVNPHAWVETVSYFGTGFRLAAGSFSNMAHFAKRLGRQWLKGMVMARAAFAT
ncbi:MAG: hypothetical protein H6Q04_2038 [Acidobacteria bacterium]|jgi:hypothetical protein|nr:hypothetical protein [Acidobacteriota bacterium]